MIHPAPVLDPPRRFDLSPPIPLIQTKIDVRIRGGLAVELGVPGQVVVSALLASALPKNRAARRFTRAVLKGVPAARIAEASAALETALREGGLKPS
jgi:hypothetical protein